MKSIDSNEIQLPPLNDAEFKIYNDLAERMEYFHNNFRQSWTLIYRACENRSRPQNLTLKQFLMIGIQFCRNLHVHHSIEELHVFPALAKKMPQFKNGPNYEGAAELLKQHQKIHEGMDVFEEYLRECLNGKAALDLEVLKTKMDSWGEVLWTHLDQEVETLKAENMRKYWTIEEMKRLPV